MGFFDELLGLIAGQPGQGSVVFPPAQLPPLYNQVSQWGPQFNSLFNTPLPGYQGQVDPGLSPTMQNLIQMMQGYATSPAPSAMQASQGALGRYTQPGMSSNPANSWLSSFAGGGRGVMDGGGMDAARQSLMRFMQPNWMNPGQQAQYGQAPNWFGGGMSGGMGQQPGGGQQAMSPRPIWGQSAGQAPGASSSLRTAPPGSALPGGGVRNNYLAQNLDMGADPHGQVYGQLAGGAWGDDAGVQSLLSSLGLGGPWGYNTAIQAKEMQPGGGSAMRQIEQYLTQRGLIGGGGAPAVPQFGGAAPQSQLNLSVSPTQQGGMEATPAPGSSVAATPAPGSSVVSRPMPPGAGVNTMNGGGLSLSPSLGSSMAARPAPAGLSLAPSGAGVNSMNGGGLTLAPGGGGMKSMNGGPLGFDPTLLMAMMQKRR